MSVSMSSPHYHFSPATEQKSMSEWFDNGLRLKATHMIIKCDERDWSYSPEYVYSTQEACIRTRESIDSTKAQTETMREIYLLDMARKEEQLRYRNNMNFC